jgi:hypothetical protein
VIEPERPCQSLAQQIGSLQGQMQALVEDRLSAARARERIADKIDLLQTALDRRVDALSEHVDARLASMEARLEARIAGVTSRVDALESTRDQGAGMLWTLRALWLAAGGALITVAAWLGDRLGLR